MEKRTKRRKMIEIVTGTEKQDGKAQKTAKVNKEEN
jgi:hypothetical protein